MTKKEQRFPCYPPLSVSTCLVQAEVKRHSWVAHMARLRLGPRASSSGQLVAPDASLTSPGDVSSSVSLGDAAGHVGVMRLRPPQQQQQPQQQRRWTTGAVAAPRAPAPPPRRASTGSLRDTPSSRWRSRRYRLSTLTMAECIEAAAVSVCHSEPAPQASTHHTRLLLTRVRLAWDSWRPRASRAAARRRAAMLPTLTRRTPTLSCASSLSDGGRTASRSRRRQGSTRRPPRRRPASRAWRSS